MWALAACLAAGCGPKPPPASATNRLDASDATQGTRSIGFESNDIHDIADKMARSLLAWGGWARMSDMPAIVVLPSKNRTRFRIDSNLATNKIMNALVKNADGAFMIYDRALWDEVQVERGMIESGTVGGQVSGAMGGADYLLHSEFRDLSTSDGNTETSYVLVNFRLVDASTTALMWTEEHEWKKEGTWDIVHQ